MGLDMTTDIILLARLASTSFSARSDNPDLFKYFTRLGPSRPLDLLRGLSERGHRKEVSMMQASSRDQARSPRGGGCDSEHLALDVASLSGLDAGALRQRWKALFGNS